MRKLAILSLMTFPLVLSAQTVSVNQSGGGTYTDIASALSFFDPDPDPATENLIQVTDSGVYDEVVNITVPVTLEATSINKATIALQSNAAGLNGNSGLVVNLPYPGYTTGTVVIRNFNIIPSLSTSGNRLSAGIEQINANVFLMLDKVVLCPNDGNNVPLVTDAITNRVAELIATNPAYNPNIVQFNDDGILAGRAPSDTIMEGDGVELLLRDTVVSHFRADAASPVGSTTPDCVVFGTGSWNPNNFFRLIRVEGQGGSSYGRIGYYLFGDVKIKGDPLKRLNIKGHSHSGVYLEFPSAATISRDIENVIIDGCSQYAIYDNGRGNVRYTLRNSILYYLGRGCTFTKKQTVAVGGDNIFEDCTMVDGRKGGYHSYRWELGNTMNIVMRNCIIGGKYDYTTQTASNQGLNTLWYSTAGGATAHFDSCAVITTGPYAMRASAFASAPTSMGSVIYSDPKFINNGNLLIPDGIPYYDSSINPGIYDPASSDFLNVTNSDYAEAGDIDPSDGVTSVPLGGGAAYVGPPSKIEDWGRYSVGSREYENSLNYILVMHERKQLRR